MVTIAFEHTALCAYGPAAIAFCFGLIALGHRILALLRDWREYRAGR
jgi:hypothetical protein